MISRAWELFWLDEIDKAKEIALRVWRRTRNQETKARAAFLLAMIESKNGNINEALEWVNKAIELGLDDANVYILQARLLMKTKNYAQALKAINRAEKIQINEEENVDYEVLFLKAKILSELGRKEEARQIITGLLEILAMDDEILALAKELGMIID